MADQIIIKMLDTCENSFKFAYEHPETGDPEIGYDVQKFYKDELYDSDDVPGGVRRCQKLIDMGLAEEVTQ